MSTYIENGQMTYIDASGDMYVLHPVTKKENVIGLSSLEDSIGDMSLLSTNEKTSLVAAINEISTGGTSNVSEAISKALAEARESGDFDGRGIVSVERTKGDGSPGTTDTYTITYTDNTTTDFEIYNGSDASGGSEGVSITHTWNGTVLEITSASGTSSADLKGDAGKSAYEYAIEGGYLGSEDEYAEKMAQVIEVDAELSNSSTNPVQNKAVASAIEGLSNHTYINGVKGINGDDNMQIYASTSLGLNAPEVLLKEDPVSDYGAATKRYVDNTVNNAVSGIAIEVDSELSITSEKPVQNKVITEALNNLKEVTVDSVLSSTSENPVQNKIVNEAISELSTLIGTESVSSQIDTAINNLPVCYTHTRVQTADTNLDDYTTIGVYYFSASYVPTNIPSGTNGWLIVMPAVPGVAGNSNWKQIWLRQGTAGVNDQETFIRTYQGGSWGPWSIVLTSILSPTLYGDTLPDPGVAGRIFFKKAGS